VQKKTISLSVEGINIVGEIYSPQDDDVESPALCICHGIPSGKPAEPTDGGYPLLAERFCDAGFVTVIFNFRGTGVSGGNFDMMGWVMDLGTVMDYLWSLPEVDKSCLCLMGFSGGAAVSAYVAAHDSRVSKVVLCACPAEFGALVLEETGQSSIEHFRRIGMIRDEDFPPSVEAWSQGFQHIAPLRWIESISPRPLLLLQGTEDDVVNADQTLRLYNRAGEPKEMALVEGGGHKLRLNEEAMDIALRWLTQKFKK